jgi:hypothetical protein
MWLPHGLASGTNASAFLPLLSLCRLASAAANASANASACEPLAFNLSLPSKARLRARVAGLEPGRRYRMAVKGDASVKDAFGMPLQVRLLRRPPTGFIGFWRRPSAPRCWAAAWRQAWGRWSLQNRLQNHLLRLACNSHR